MSSKENIVKDDTGENNETTEEKKADSNDNKLVRILTVVAYLVAVSTPAVILSSYYIFIWDSTGHFANITNRRR